jgi:hypothetical protein
MLSCKLYNHLLHWRLGLGENSREQKHRGVEMLNSGISANSARIIYAAYQRSPRQDSHASTAGRVLVHVLSHLPSWICPYRKIA